MDRMTAEHAVVTRRLEDENAELKRKLEDLS
jgi:hypothetical protein